MTEFSINFIPNCTPLQRTTRFLSPRKKNPDSPQLLFHLPLSVTAFAQLQILSLDLQNLHLTLDNDKWTYIWGSTNLSVAKAYKTLCGHLLTYQAVTHLVLRARLALRL